METTKYTETLGPINGYTFKDVSYDFDAEYLNYTVLDGDACPVKRHRFVHINWYGTPERVFADVSAPYGRHGHARDSEVHELLYYDSKFMELWDAHLLCEICAIVEGVY